MIKNTACGTPDSTTRANTRAGTRANKWADMVANTRANTRVNTRANMRANMRAIKFASHSRKIIENLQFAVQIKIFHKKLFLPYHHLLWAL